MMTLPLIFPLNILPKTGRRWAVQGRQQACTLWQWSCRGEGWLLLHPQALTVAPGRSGEGAHLGSASIQISAASKPGFREVKENSKPQCFWFPRNIQSCAIAWVVNLLTKNIPRLCCAPPNAGVRLSCLLFTCLLLSGNTQGQASSRDHHQLWSTTLFGDLLVLHGSAVFCFWSYPSLSKQD